MKTELSQYDRQAADFLAETGIKLRITLSDTKTPSWGKDGKHGHHYRVTLSSGKGLSSLSPNLPRRLTFDFWDSISAMEKDETPSAYSVLACVASDSHCSESFEDFCGDMGESTDSIRALQTFRRCASFAKRIREFFTASELEQLREIS